MKQRATSPWIHLVESPQNVSDARLFFGGRFRTLRLSSYVGMGNRLVRGAALAAFGISLGSGFHFDDYAIFSDSLFRSSGGWRTLWAHPRRIKDFMFYLRSLDADLSPN